MERKYSLFLTGLTVVVYWIVTVIRLAKADMTGAFEAMVIAWFCLLTYQARYCGWNTDAEDAPKHVV